MSEREAGRENDMGFPWMADVVPEGRSGNVRVEHFTVSDADVALSNMRAAWHGDRYAHIYAGRYAALKEGGTLWMSDTHMERRTNTEALRRSHGRVLIAGLGLGMVVHAMLARPEVEHITVLEVSPDVIALVGPTLATPSVSIIQADALTWQPSKGAKWDVIYFDIWPDVCEDNLDTAAKLSRKYASRFDRSNPKAWMGGWRVEELRAHRDRERAYAY